MGTAGSCCGEAARARAAGELVEAPRPEPGRGLEEFQVCGGCGAAPAEASADGLRAPEPGWAEDEAQAEPSEPSPYSPKQGSVGSVGSVSTFADTSPLRLLGLTRDEVGSQSPDSSLSPLSGRTQALLEKVKAQVDDEFRILEAETLLADLQTRLREEELHGEVEWEAVEALTLFERFSSNLDLYHLAGQTCCDEANDWFNLYKDATGSQTISGCFDPDCARSFYYRVCLSIPVGLPQVMAVANEVHLGQQWQPLLIAPPDVLGRRTACKMVVHSQMSMMGGMFKLDVLNDIKRFVNTEGGFLAEYIKSADKDHPCYVGPTPGFRRPESEIMNVWAACGPNHTILIQVGKVQLPIPVTRWVAHTIGGLGGKRILEGLTRNALRSTEPGNPWAAPLAEDKLGFYKLLAEAVQAPASLDRSPADGALAPKLVHEGFGELQRYFGKRKLRGSCTHRNVEN